MSNIVETKEYELVKLINDIGIKIHTTRVIGFSKTRFHWHKEIEFILVTDGPIVVYTEDREIQLNQNDIFILNANEAHCLQKTKDSNEIIVMQLSIGPIKERYSAISRIHFIDQYINKTEKPELYADIFDVIQSVLEDLHRKQEGFQLDIQGRIYNLLYRLIRGLKFEQISEEQEAAKSKNLKRIDRIVSWIQKNFSYKITLSEIAEREELSVYYLSHYINKHLGVSFQKYVNSLRLEKAVELLCNTNKKKIDICVESGYADYRYLKKAFLKEYHCTPSEFRERYKDKYIRSSIEAHSFDDQYIMLPLDVSYQHFKRYLNSVNRDQQ
jgi:AraC-like DNA-binding protein/mannose-6-phosphate isomerase-like protein (cupin superfamily)